MQTYVFDVDLLPLLVVLSAFLVFPVQLLLCFRVRSRILRVLPPALLAVAETVLSILTFCVTDGWDSLGYLFFALVVAMMLLLCGIAGGIWALTRRQRKP